jgi:O-antigen/teichoic acid export membrane protein
MSSNFVKNTSKLLAGNTVAQLIGIISIPIITRLYSVEVYGVFATILAFSLILTPISTMSLHLAILIPKSEFEADNIFKLSMWIMSSFCIILTVILLAFSDDILSMLGTTLPEWIIYIIPILVFLQSCYLIFTYWRVRQKNFGILSSSKVAESLTDRIVAIAAGVAGYVTIHSLLLARLLSNLISILLLIPLYRRKKINTKDIKQEHRSYKYIIIKYKRYLIFNAPSILLINCIRQLPVIIFAAYFSPVAAGLYSIANRVVSIPVSAMGNAISKTFTQKIAVENTKKNIDGIRNNTHSFFTVLFNFILIPFSVLSVIGDSIFGIVLGDKWEAAGVLASSLSYFAMSTLIVQAFGGLFDVMNKQQTRLIFHVCNFIVQISVLFFCIYLGFDLFKTVLYFAIFATLMNIVAMALLLMCVDQLETLILVLIRNVFPLSLFHLLAAFIMYYFESLLLSYLLIVSISILWFFIFGGINQVKKLKNNN